MLKNSLKLTNVDYNGPCHVCHKAKQTRDSFSLSEHKSKVFGELIHLDVWGPYKMISREGYRYFLTVVDDYSRSVWVYLLKRKDEVFDMFVSFYNMVLTQFNKKIKIIRSDNGTEFINNKINDFVNTMGIIHQTSVAYTLSKMVLLRGNIDICLMFLEVLCFRGGFLLCFGLNAS